MGQRDFPGDLVIETLPSSGAGAGSVSSRGGQIPHASCAENQNIQQKQHCNSSIKIFKIVHSEKNLKRKKKWVTQPSGSRSGNIHSCGQKAHFQSFTRSRTVMRDSNAWQKMEWICFKEKLSPFHRQTQNPHSPMRACLHQESSYQPY